MLPKTLRNKIYLFHFYLKMWLHTQKEELKFDVYENRVPKEIFGSVLRARAECKEKGLVW
jgi:hypothetical protein